MAFFNRINDIAKVWRLLRKDKSLLMLAPRRIGKTQLMHKLKVDAAHNGFRAVVCDVEGCRDEKQFLREICQAIESEKGAESLLTHLSMRLKRLLRGSETPPTSWQQWLGQIDYKEFAEALLAGLNEERDARWIVMVDEAPLFILSMLNGGDRQRVHDFLYWLRNLRQRYTNVLWLYTGSIGLDTIARREDLTGAFNDMEPFELPPFAAAEARDFLRHLARQEDIALSDAALDHALNRLGWLSPYYLEKLIDEIASNDGTALRAAARKAELAEVDRACEALLGRGKQTYWAAWREHLNKNFKEPEQSLLKRLLATMAKNANGVSLDSLRGALADLPSFSEETLRAALDVLIGDGYISEWDAENERRRFGFRMDLLRRWWLRYM